MKKNIIITAIAILALTCSCKKDPVNMGDGWGVLHPDVTDNTPSAYVFYPNAIKVMSFNVRYLNDNDGDNNWDKRKKGVFAMMKSEQPLVMGTQECKWQQRQDILQGCPMYAAIGVCRDDGKEGSTSETMSIFYLKDSVTVEKWGTYWLSETPDTPSKGWDGQCYRCATWGVFKEKRTGRQFFYTNTHLDHKGPVAKENGAALLVKKTSELNALRLPSIVTADFNMKITDEKLSPVVNSFSNAKTKAFTTDPSDTYQGFGTATNPGIIDHIFYNDFTKCIKYKVVNDKFLDVPYISDHYPIYAILQY